MEAFALYIIYSDIYRATPGRWLTSKGIVQLNESLGHCWPQGIDLVIVLNSLLPHQDSKSNGLKSAKELFGKFILWLDTWRFLSYF
jgi:hypothetical protein